MRHAGYSLAVALALATACAPPRTITANPADRAAEPVPLPKGALPAPPPVTLGQQGELPEGALYQIDGRDATRAEAHALLASSIARIEILKGAAAVERLGERARTGAILFTTTRPQSAPRD